MSFHSLPRTDTGPLQFVHRPSTKKPVHCACGEGKLDVVKHLIEEQGVDVSTEDVNGNKPIFYAMMRGKLEVVKYLIESGVSVNSPPNTIYPSLLHHAAACGNREICEYLIGKGAVVNSYNLTGLTPLFFAAFRGSDVTAEALIHAGAEVNISHLHPHSGTPPFLIAAKEGYPNMLRILYASGANPEVSDRDEMTPLHHAIDNEFVDIVRLLVIDFNVSLNRQNHRYHSPLRLAMICKNEDIVRLLISAGCNLSQERWICDYTDIAASINSTRQKIMKYLRRLASQTKSLQDLCCFQIRQVVRATGHRRPFWESVDSLPVPTKVKEFIKLSHLSAYAAE